MSRKKSRKVNCSHTTSVPYEVPDRKGILLFEEKRNEEKLVSHQSVARQTAQHSCKSTTCDSAHLSADEGGHLCLLLRHVHQWKRLPNR